MMQAIEVAQTTTSLIDERLASGDTIMFTVTSSSMMPFLKPGDKIIIEGKRMRKTQVGDIVLIRPGVVWLVHRVIKSIGRGENVSIVTKGDNHSIVDPPWRSDQIVGWVVAIERDDRIVHLKPLPAETLNRVLAYLSSGQAILNRIPIDLARGLAVKSSRLGIRLITRWIYWYAKQPTR